MQILYFKNLFNRSTYLYSYQCIGNGTSRSCGYGWKDQTESCKEMEKAGKEHIISEKATHCYCKTDLCNGSNELIFPLFCNFLFIIVVTLISYLLK